MKATLQVLAFLGLGVRGAFPQPIDFTPRFETTLADGFAMRRLTFANGARKISSRLPEGWQVAGGSEAVRFSSPAFMQAGARIENAPAGMPARFDAAGCAIYRRIALSLAPVGGAEVELLSERLDAVEINDWQGFEVSFSYTLPGERFVCRVLFLKLDAEHEVRVVADARMADFEKFYGVFFRSLASWHVR